MFFKTLTHNTSSAQSIEAQKPKEDKARDIRSAFGDAVLNLAEAMPNQRGVSYGMANLQAAHFLEVAIASFLDQVPAHNDGQKVKSNVKDVWDGKGNKTTVLNVKQGELSYKLDSKKQEVYGPVKGLKGPQLLAKFISPTASEPAQEIKFGYIEELKKMQTIESTSTDAKGDKTVTKFAYIKELKAMQACEKFVTKQNGDTMLRRDAFIPDLNEMKHVYIVHGLLTKGLKQETRLIYSADLKN